MNIINQEVQDITQTDFSYKGAMKFAEEIGRICYNSSDKITEDSWKSFTNMLIKNKHYSPFGHVFLHIKTEPDSETFNILNNLVENYKGSSLRYVCSYDASESPEYWYWTISMRLIVEYLNKKEQKIIFKCIDENDDHYEHQSSFLCTTSIAVTRELNRHGWNLNIMEKSTRYTECFDIIKPYWYDSQKWYIKLLYKMTCKVAFINYKILLKLGFKKQESRGVLPLDTATQVIYTALNYQWSDLFDKRLVPGAHPDCRKLVGLIHENINY
jgi:thymidylate synthase ThyX